MEFEKRDRQFFIVFLTISGCQDSDVKKNIDDFYFEKSSSIKKLSTETLMKELNQVVMEKSEFQH